MEPIMAKIRSFNSLLRLILPSGSGRACKQSHADYFVNTSRSPQKNTPTRGVIKGF